MSEVNDFALYEDEDLISWNLDKNGKFSVKSFYNALTSNGVGLNHNMIWKRKVPPKVKIFMWFLQNNTILKKGNMAKKTGLGVQSVIFVIRRNNLSLVFLLSYCLGGLVRSF